MGKFFGARQEDKSLYAEEGYLDFQKTRNTLLFRKAEESIMLGINRGNKIALMCTEKDLIDCHRTILVSKAFYDSEVPVEHILENGTTMNQKAINERLLNRYFPERDQLSIFYYINGGEAEEELLEKAYVLRNKVIGYYIDSTPIMAKLGGR